MAIIIVKERITGEDFAKAREEYESYIKITMDIERGVLALGGEYHADAEKMLIETGSRQANIWGGGVNLETHQFETNAIINLRPGRNNSTEILEERVRRRFLEIAKKILRGYV